MKERPILFSGPMVQAILDGRKTQTRRIVKPQPRKSQIDNGTVFSSKDPFMMLTKECPYGKVGDSLWVRENHALIECVCQAAPAALRGGCKECGGVGTIVEYAADGKLNGKQRPSIHMPRWASRITLQITDIRVERLQEIDEIDAEAEGLEVHEFTDAYGTERRAFSFGDYLSDNGVGTYDYSAVSVFEELWKSINGHDSWDANPWVFVVNFARVFP